MTHFTAALYCYLQALHTICAYDRNTRHGAQLFIAFQALFLLGCLLSSHYHNLAEVSIPRSYS